MIVQDLRERLTNDQIALYQWILMDLMWVDVLMKEMELNKDMKNLLMEGVFYLEDHEISKRKSTDKNEKHNKKRECTQSW